MTAEPDATRSGTTLPVATLSDATLSDATLSDATLCHDTHCITCGDDGIPMTVLAVDAQRGLALCTDADERHHTVETALVEPVAPGQTLLVHAGTAIAGGDGHAGTAIAGGDGHAGTAIAGGDRRAGTAITGGAA